MISTVRFKWILRSREADPHEAVPANKNEPRGTDSVLKTENDLLDMKFCKIHNFNSTRPNFANFISMESEEQVLCNHALCLMFWFWKIGWICRNLCRHNLNIKIILDIILMWNLCKMVCFEPTGPRNQLMDLKMYFVKLGNK